MKKTLLILATILLSFTFSHATTFTITAGASNFVFSPSDITINPADIVTFSLASIHDVVEVSQATYNANGNTQLSGGFSLPFGGGSLTNLTPGIHYFVCSPHASIGMKGTITVTEATSVSFVTSGENELKLSPNPASDYVRISYTIESKSFISINLFDAIGKNVANILSEMREPGILEETYNVSRLRPGLYILSLRYDNKSIVRKLIIK